MSSPAWFARVRSRLPKPFAVAVLFALVLIPVLYATALVSANSDPTGHLDNIPAAIVDQDTGATFSSTRVDLGSDVVDTLTSSDAGFSWKQADAQAAANGLADGTYLAVLTIPADFSANATSTATSTPQDASSADAGTLTLTTNDSVSYLVGSMGKTIGTTLADGLSQQVASSYLRNVYLGFTTLHDTLTTAADGAQTLATSTGTLDSGAGDLSAGLATLSSKASALPTAVTRLSSGAASAQSGATSLASGLTTLTSGASSVADGAGAAVKGATNLADGIDTLSAAGTQLANGASTLSDGLDQLAASYDSLSDAQRKALLTQLAAGAQTLNAGTATLNQTLPALDSGAHQLVGSATSGTGLSALAAGAAQVRDGATSATAGATSLADGLGTLSGGLGQLGTATTTLQQAVGTAATGAATLSDGATKLDQGASDLASGLTKGAAQVPAYTQQQATSLSTAAASPVKLDLSRDNAVSTNGAGLAPYFIALAMWIGALATFLMRDALPARLLWRRTAAPLTAVRSWLPAAILGVAQAAVTVLVVHAAVGVHVANLPGLVGLVMLTSLAFMAINQALIALLGVSGRFVALLLIVLQLASAGGTYPIQTAPAFFRAMHQVLPLTYAVQGLRSMIAGGTYGVSTAVGTLAGWLVGGLVVTTLAVLLQRRRATVQPPELPELAVTADALA